MIARFPQPAGSSQPDSFGRFFLQRLIGRGGATSVYLAHDPSLGQDVALRVLLSGNDELRERFMIEARSAARLRHPNVVAVTDVGAVNDRPYVAMEFVEGETLGNLLKRRAPLSTERRLSMAMDMTDGLAHAHRQGVVHGDLRPEHVIVAATGAVKILDFGHGRVTSAAGLTNPHIPIGPFNYMSPEHIAGRPLTPHSDMFSFGAVLFELFSGQQAFPGARSTRLLHRMLAGEHDPFLSIDADLPAEAAWVVQRLLHPEPAGRFESLTVALLELAIARDKLASAQTKVVVEVETDVSAPSTSCDEAAVPQHETANRAGTAAAAAPTPTVLRPVEVVLATAPAVEVPSEWTKPLPIEATEAILRQLEDLDPRQKDLGDLLNEFDRLEEASRSRRRVLGDNQAAADRS